MNTLVLVKIQNLTKMDDRQTGRGGGRIWAGLFLLLVGGVLLLDQMGFPLPDWLFTWHVLLIAVGLFIGLRHNFRGGGWLIMMLIGGFFLVQDNFPNIPFHRFLWPGALILVGLLIIIRPGRSYMPGREWREKTHWHDWRHRNWQSYDQANPEYKYSNEDFLDSTSVFSGVHKKIVSKQFRGGDVTNILGGTELDFSQADINGKVLLDVTQIMGGTKIIVPSHWEVRSEVTAVFAGFEDKRQQPVANNPDKLLILQGTSIFGGIELKNF
jgi:predicted membrane protein